MTNLLLALCVLGSVHVSDQFAFRRDANTTIDIDCDPALSKRMDDCPKGYCCVRDEFLPTYVYCKKMGLPDEHCTTRTTESACPCVAGLTCVPNINSGAIHSLYGECKHSTDVVG